MKDQRRDLREGISEEGSLSKGGKAKLIWSKGAIFRPYKNRSRKIFNYTQLNNILTQRLKTVTNSKR